MLNCNAEMQPIDCVPIQPVLGVSNEAGFGKTIPIDIFTRLGRQSSFAAVHVSQSVRPSIYGRWGERPVERFPFVTANLLNGHTSSRHIIFGLKLRIRKSKYG